MEADTLKTVYGIVQDIIDQHKDGLREIAFKSGAELYQKLYEHGIPDIDGVNFSVEAQVASGYLENSLVSMLFVDLMEGLLKGSFEARRKSRDANL